MKSIQICGDEQMARIRMCDVAEQIRGVSYKTEDVLDGPREDAVGIFRASNISDGIINFNDLVFVKRNKVLQKQMLRKGDILICASSGSKHLVGKAAQIEADCEYSFGAFCKVVRPQKINALFLGMYFQSDFYRRYISDISQGANINNIKNEHIDAIKLRGYSETEQVEIAELLQKIISIIRFHKEQLIMLDELIKSRFVEMFGNPVTNSSELKMLPMTSVCEIIDGDRGENYPKAEDFSEEGDCLFLNAKNVTASGFNFDTCMYITKEKDESLRKGKLKRGDVVLTTRGTLGNLAYYTDKIPYDNIRINSGMVILRMKRKVIDEIYFIEHFKFQLDDIKSKIASGSAQPQLPISTMNKIQIIIPEIGKQKEFAAFVHQVDKLKLTTQKSLKKLEILKKSLMQEYFG